MYKLSAYARTVLLNLLFVILIPVILTFAFATSMTALIIYLCFYSLVEYYIDEMCKDTSVLKLNLKEYLATVMFNAIIIFGISIILQFFLFNAGLIVVTFLMLLWILAISKLEIKVEKAIERKVNKWE